MEEVEDKHRFLVSHLPLVKKYARAFLWCGAPFDELYHVGWAANALLERGYGKPPQHITGEGGPSYVVRLPEPCKTAEEWEASIQHLRVPASSLKPLDG
jgi:hypothetical protein